MNIMKFAKRFDALAIKEKMLTLEKLAQYTSAKQMPSGRKMTDTECVVLRSLANWCNDNIFFGAMPHELNNNG